MWQPAFSGMAVACAFEELRGELLNELDYISSRGEHPCRRFHTWATSVIRVIPSLDFEATEPLAVCDTARFTL